MAFWGVEVKPGKPYTHQFDRERGRLHISQATLGIGSSTKKCLVQCNVGDKSPIFLCALLPDKTESCPLDLEFEEEEEVVFSVVGPTSVHLTGFYLGNGRDSCEHDEDTDSYGEDIGESETEESTDYDSEDEYEDDFIDDDDDDLQVFPPSPVPNCGVVIEEILDDEKPTVNGSSKNPKKKKNQLSASDSDDNESSQKQIVIQGSSGVPVLESEDEDGFPISSHSKNKRNEKKADTKVQGKAGKKRNEKKTEAKVEEKTSKKTSKEEKKKAQDDGDKITSLKRKIDAIVEDGKPESGGADQPHDPSVPSSETDSENGMKPKKKKKERSKERKSLEAGKDDKSDALKEEKSQSEEKKNNIMDQDLPLRDEEEQNLPNDKCLDIDADPVAAESHSEKKKRKRKKKNKIEENVVNVNTKESVLTKEPIAEAEDKTAAAKPSQKRTFPNGLVIEELAMGKPDGKRANPGKKVAVHYIGKLEKNGQIFDSNIGRAPFKFRLGVGHVIKGWDVGVNGMRVGDKRRITVPPAMGYGSQGAGGKIPPNATLLFDVELVEVH